MRFGILREQGRNDDRWLPWANYPPSSSINNLPFRMASSGVKAIRFGAWNDVWLGTSSGQTHQLGQGRALAAQRRQSGHHVRQRKGAKRYFAGVMTIGPGEIPDRGRGAGQRTARACASGVENNVGRIAGYNAFAPVVPDTDGRFKAGGGAVVIDATGMWLQVALAQLQTALHGWNCDARLCRGLYRPQPQPADRRGREQRQGSSFVMQAYNGANVCLSGGGRKRRDGDG